MIRMTPMTTNNLLEPGSNSTGLSALCENTSKDIENIITIKSVILLKKFFMIIYCCYNIEFREVMI